EVPGDLIIAALGFDAEDLSDWSVELTRWGTVKADPFSFATNEPGVYAAGDIVRGASLVVWAIREGRDVADAMHAYIQSRAKVAAE
ncbi:MAG: FAD-dependent oxidoreductase, partial [Terricaulis sp.]